MRAKFQTTLRPQQQPERMRRGAHTHSFVRAVVAVGFVVCVAQSSRTSEIRQVGSARPVNAVNDVVISEPHVEKPKASPAIEARVERLLSDLDLADRQVSEAVPILLEALRDTNVDPMLRARSATMLARIGERARVAVPVLVEILERSLEETSRASDEQSEKKSATIEDTSYWVMKSLGLFGSVSAEAVPTVTRFLTEPATSSQLRVLAADTLGQIRTSAAVGVLTAELMKPRRRSDYEAIVLRETIIDGLALAGPFALGAIPALSRAAEDDHADVRRKACDALGALGPRAEGAMNSLFERLILDEDPAVQDAAANALAQVGPPAFDSLTDLLERGGRELQWRAAKALGQAGVKARSTVEPLKLAFSNPSANVRIEAVDAAWKITRDPQVVAGVLVELLREDDRQIRRRAAGLLVELPTLSDETSAALRRLVDDGNSNEARAAAYVIRERARRTSEQKAER